MKYLFVLAISIVSATTIYITSYNKNGTKKTRFIIDFVTQQ